MICISSGLSFQAQQMFNYRDDKEWGRKMIRQNREARVWGIFANPCRKTTIEWPDVSAKSNTILINEFAHVWVEP